MSKFDILSAEYLSPDNTQVRYTLADRVWDLPNPIPAGHDEEWKAPLIQGWLDGGGTIKTYVAPSPVTARDLEAEIDALTKRVDALETKP